LQRKRRRLCGAAHRPAADPVEGVHDISGAAGADSPLVEQWVYDFGTSKPLRVLTFVGGRLQRIEDVGRPR
jgi:hypothetical protein